MVGNFLPDPVEIFMDLLALVITGQDSRNPTSERHLLESLAVKGFRGLLLPLTEKNSCALNTWRLQPDHIEIHDQKG